MKKYLQKSLAVFSAVAICLGLCGCNKLDDLKDRQAFMVTENGKVAKIVYHEKDYKPLENATDLFVIPKRSINITEQDMPVLLSPFLFKTYSTVTEDEKIIISDDSTYYCREDYYDELQQKINNHTLNRFAFQYSFFDEKESDWMNKTHILSAEESAYLLQKVKNIEAENQPDIAALFLNNGAENAEGNVLLHLSSEDGLFQNDDFSINLYYINQNYYICKETNDESGTYHNYVSVVEPQNKALIQAIFEKYNALSVERYPTVE